MLVGVGARPRAAVAYGVDRPARLEDGQPHAPLQRIAGVAAGRKIFRDQFPPDITLYLIEAQSLDIGIELSPPVRRSAVQLVAQIEREIDAYPSH